MASRKELILVREGVDSGPAADVVVFYDGVTVLHWRTNPNSTEIYPTEAAMRFVREASGRSRLIGSAVACHFCNVMVDKGEDGKVHATHPKHPSPWYCFGSTSGKHQIYGESNDETGR